MATFINVVIMIASTVLGVIVGGAATGKFWGGAVGFVAGLMLGELIRWILEKCGVFDRMLDKEIDKSYKKQNKKDDKERERQQAKREKEEAIAKSDRQRDREGEIRSKANRFLNNPRAEEMVNRCVSQFDFSVPNELYYYGTDGNTNAQTKEEKADFAYYFQVTSDYIRWARNEYSGNWTEFNFQKNGYSSQNDYEKLSSLLCAVTERIKDGYKSRYPSCKVSSIIHDSRYEDYYPKGTVTVFVYRQVSNPNYGKTDW